MFALLREDLRTVRRHTGCTVAQALLYPSVVAMWTYRIAHVLRRHRILARLLSNLGRLLSGGVEIHPGATLGRRLFIAHGNGVVIGETAIVGDDVVLCQQVTLGAVGWWRDNARAPGQRRHPRLGNRVVVHPNASLLGPLTVGDDAVIEAQSLVLRDVRRGAVVTCVQAQ
ncbi:serine O-acetyltransferase [Lentzea nigeriaca]|uniref:serine O-acetyltransferase n=1 Tax=Lentzea nigeriaca TaxID=1128665 RepID=UPI00195CE264|nr:serine O-acetyltransferase [Lentzea nigeriaca]MBM7856367.1 serine O-acetyltransferase [Lentzea nigeriaca]